MVPDYIKEDFLNGTAPYEEVYQSHSDPFKHAQHVALMVEHAQSVGFRGFVKTYKDYVNSLRQAENTLYIQNTTAFTGQIIELNAGDWDANDWGVSRKNGMFKEDACVHPIMPIERLVNIDTGIEKLKISYSKGKKWREVIADKKTLASANSILSLADMGVAVNSENAKHLVKYLHDIENMNYDAIPERKSVGRLGYIDNEGFSPYVDGLIFDGDANFKTIFDSIKPHGKRQKWIDIALLVRRGNVMARMVLAAAFASVLVRPLGGLPFFVHLWGGESGTGKTVALMLAASVWADPYMGKYIQTFNSTVVGREKLAAFLDSLPLMVDELQLAKDSRGKLVFDVYALAEGVGRTRGTRTGGIDKTPTWSNCILTTGETPITSIGSGAGAINRVIEIECLTSEKIIDDGHGTANELKKHHGFAGREFVEQLYKDDNIEKAQAIYKEAFLELSANDTTEKQSMAAAIIIVADKLATDWIFKDGKALSVADVSSFLQSKAAVSANERGYRYMCDWVTQNANKLRKDNETGDIYGLIDGDMAYIINSVFCRAVSDGGYSPAALLSYLKQSGLILVRDKNNTRGKRINGVLTECVCMKLSNIEEWEDVKKDDKNDTLPF